MGHLTPDFLDFVEAWLPPPPARVLEVGCGRGDLARAIAERGHEVVAIDPEAPEGDIFLAVPLEELAAPGPFDAVIANRSLHHVADLSGALDKIASLLPPEGPLILHEHAWERLDSRTARWFLEQRSATDPKAPSLEQFMVDWEAEHTGLHSHATMKPALDLRFTERFFAWTAYLHGELDETVSAEQEQVLIDIGSIQATGFRYVGARLL
jgi:SAM-dependent methyltransferase